eukprot:Phypoly_transcript_15847.p1 GENE.Phypoly_transcript_15847~~Phypoly_transcript_15847.p1  ORF type:complete len:277 (+),score=48.38 Phypoly_transcript_15847:40-831(+)
MAASKQGRLELLSWLNEYLETDYPKIESLGDGIAYCQLFDAISPGTVPLHKLNFSAKFPEDNAKNYKILDEVFQKAGILKIIPTQALIKGKFQENKEFLQWCFNYMSQQCPEGLPAYNAYKRRAQAIKSQEGAAGNVNSNLLPNKFSAVSPPTTRSKVADKKQANSKNNNTEAQAEKQAKELEQLIASLEVELKESLLETHDFEFTLENSKAERDFYYSKLLAIEKLCTEKYSSDPYAAILMQKIAKEVPGFKKVDLEKNQQS